MKRSSGHQQAIWVAVLRFISVQDFDVVYEQDSSGSSVLALLEHGSWAGA
jgi:hypothetical protein